MNKKLLKMLYRSFDGRLSKEEQSILVKALENSEELKQEKERIIKIRNDIAAQSDQKFQPNFADRVMRSIHSKQALQNGQIDEFFNSLVLSFGRIAIAGAAGAVLILAANFISGGEISLDTALALQHVTIEDALSINDIISGIVK